MNVIDLFSGAGGLTEGFLQNGYNFVAHIEKEYWACETLKTRLLYHHLLKLNDRALYDDYLRASSSYKELHTIRQIIFDKYPYLEEIVNDEVQNLTFGDPSIHEGSVNSDSVIHVIEKNMKKRKIKDISLIIGGPPCQAYSLVGRGRMKESVNDDSRNYLFKYYLDMVNHFNPKAFVFENVPGLLTAMKGEVFKEIIQQFNDIGYTVLTGPNENHKKNIINTINYGVHQKRKRLILFGFKKCLNLDYPDFKSYACQFDNLTTYDAIGDLNPLNHNEGDDFNLEEYSTNENLSEYQKLMRENSIGIINHKARKHRLKDLNIYKKVIDKASIGIQLKYTDLEKNEQYHNNKTSFLDRYKTHWWTNTPHTVVAHISKDGHYNIHPDINQLRSLTVREAARIQSFPDNYKFEGPRTAQFTQVGNAVPPLLSSAIAKTILDII